MRFSLALTHAIVAPVCFSAGLPLGFLAPTQQARQQSLASATIAPAASVGESIIRVLPGGEIVATSSTLRELILFAHRSNPFQRLELVGGPDWIATDRFDLRAVVASGHEYDAEGKPENTLSLLRNLLVEKFALAIREGTRTQPIYLLSRATPIGTLGPKLRRSDVDCGAVMKGEQRPIAPGQGPPCSTKTLPGRLFANGFSMQAISSLLSNHLDRPVVDGTGLYGLFEFELEAVEITPPTSYKPGPSDLALPLAPGTSIFVAVREQLGLRLEPRDGPVPVLVIEQARRFDR